MTLRRQFDLRHDFLNPLVRIANHLVVKWSLIIKFLDIAIRLISNQAQTFSSANRTAVFARLLSSILLGAVVTRGALFTDPSQLSSTKKYDYIVVGAGPGGSVVANRLSENSSVNVLLIEAGISDEGVLPVEVPFLAAQLEPNTPFCWNYTTTPQSGLNGRVVQYPRGKMLGGSSSINFMVWTRGSQDDFNRYAAVSGDSGWSWESLQPYWQKIEKLVAPADNHVITGEIDPSIHGTSGPLDITLPGYPEFPFNLDMNSGNTIGVGWAQYTIGDGSRASSSTAYVEPFLSRANFDVLIQTQVTKVIQTGTQSGTPVFRGVQFAQSSSGPRYALNATTEVILSAGAINSPQILMLSGIGPKSQLSKLGIKTVVDLPVGGNLSDHALLSNQFTVSQPDVIDTITRNSTLANAAVGQWLETKTGVMVDGPGNHIGWIRIPKNDSIFKTQTDPSAGPTSSHFEFLFLPGFVSLNAAAPATGNFMSVFTNVVSPSSRGSVTLASTDPFAFPNINPAFLSTIFDVYTMRYAVKSLQRFVAAPAWSGYVTGQAGDFAGVTTDSEIDAWARSQTDTVWHPVGTASMSPCGSDTGVVNPDLTVKGVIGLRVVDASVLPYVPAAHTQAAVKVAEFEPWLCRAT
ncbi:Pyranose dehydrogenase 1 [Grifola frondosa]|uniref:Pyranose dehydrogenase 1 n=1 Tax=Grifola frondosa TaxID=5627 RepID=A0A1C7M7Z9_GRIFR|nr:Pyranose dehydrogenase 1 [Grifola frondosa]